MGFPKIWGYLRGSFKGLLEGFRIFGVPYFGVLEPLYYSKGTQAGSPDFGKLPHGGCESAEQTRVALAWVGCRGSSGMFRALLQCRVESLAEHAGIGVDSSKFLTPMDHRCEDPVLQVGPPKAAYFS